MPSTNYLDQMNIKANESDTQGVDHDLRDKDLNAADAVTSVGSTDSVVLKGTDGSYHKIVKSSFMSAVRDALGAIIKNVDKGTAINGIAVTGSASPVNDLGFSSPSDLASVLGVFTTKNYAGVGNNGFRQVCKFAKSGNAFATIILSVFKAQYKDNANNYTVTANISYSSSYTNTPYVFTGQEVGTTPFYYYDDGTYITIYCFIPTYNNATIFSIIYNSGCDFSILWGTDGKTMTTEGVVRC